MEEEYHYPPAFMRALEKALSHNKGGLEGALLVCAIDNLPMIISGYGHTRAEKMLREVKANIAALLQPEDKIYRLQRDQFAIIAPKMDALRLTTTVRSICDCLKRYGITSAMAPLHLVPMVGAALFSDSPSSSVKLRSTRVIDAAYLALKQNHLSYHTSPGEVVLSDSAASIKQMEMANHIHTAIHHNRLQLAYQPIIHTATGAVAHYECLLRLKSEDGSIQSAGALIPVAERMGLIDLIDQMVLEMVVEDLLRCPDVVLGFNVSNLTTSNPEWMELLERMLQDVPEIASRMIVEITETAAQRDLDETARFVKRLQGFGCKVALDDFGSGYTSFRQLKALSCDVIKIDGFFIRELENNPDNRFFVKTLLDFTQGMGLQTVAEMVETGEAAKILMDLGVEYMQGYYFGKPVNERVWLKP
jgi:EAL domain-containing protein (putative c-di-GMP-specific phosphodiesterase class I)/GGDEF domain-containing protein